MAGGKIKAILYSLTPESAARVQAALMSGKMPTGMPRTGSNAYLNIIWLLVLGAEIYRELGTEADSRDP